MKLSDEKDVQGALNDQLLTINKSTCLETDQI